MLRYRLITGPLLIAFMVGLVWLDERLGASGNGGETGQGWPRGILLLALGLVVAPLIARETTRMLASVGVAVREWLAMASATVAFVAVALLPKASSPALATGLLATLFVVVLIGGLLVFSAGHNVKGVLASAGGLLLATVYGGVLLAFWPLIRNDHSAWVLVGAVLLTKSCDIGAYFTGMAIGRHRLIEWLSPKKTWEGLVGGVATSTAVGAGLAALSSHLPVAADHLPIWVGAVGGVMAGLIGQIGDLAESLFKRDAGMKDSGRILPGMGGVLDVLDSLLLSGPALYWLLWAVSG
ncbi:MAG: phosphatidate cytidylyltransferase [Phycisphaerae bacterium]|nr:phosphatidate cytidylyltransferase [Phycisphaerae bacterium]